MIEHANPPTSVKASEPQSSPYLSIPLIFIKFVKDELERDSPGRFVAVGESGAYDEDEEG